MNNNISDYYPMLVKLNVLHFPYLTLVRGQAMGKLVRFHSRHEGPRNGSGQSYISNIDCSQYGMPWCCIIWAEVKSSLENNWVTSVMYGTFVCIRVCMYTCLSCDMAIWLRWMRFAQSCQHFIHQFYVCLHDCN